DPLHPEALPVETVDVVGQPWGRIVSEKRHSGAIIEWADIRPAATFAEGAQDSGAHEIFTRFVCNRPQETVHPFAPSGVGRKFVGPRRKSVVWWITVRIIGRTKGPFPDGLQKVGLHRAAHLAVHARKDLAIALRKKGFVVSSGSPFIIRSPLVN